MPETVDNGVLKLDDLAPDGVRVIVNWDKMLVGMSVFVPCINTEAARTQAQVIMLRKEWGMEHRVRTEGGKLGVRVWRTV